MSSIQAFAMRVKTLADGTIHLLLRLEGDGVGETTLHACSMYKGDLFLVEKIERAPDTVKIPALHPIVEMSPSLLAS